MLLALALPLAVSAPSPERLPNLVQRAPYHLVLRDGRLAFGSRVDNLGAGPMTVTVVRGAASQVVLRRDGRINFYPSVGTARYVRSADHAHWHLLGFERYELRRDGRRLVRDAKTGFCLFDRVRAGSVLPPAYLRDCGRGEPAAERVEMGISPGYGDAYDPFLEGQSLDVRGLPGGVYTLVHRVNVDRRLRESRYDDDVASVRIRLVWTGGGRGRVVVLRG
jgi:Lysyl oxidase